MQEIKCPKCGEVFVVDESGYANIVKQVRDKEFARELKKRHSTLKTAKAVFSDSYVQNLNMAE